MLKKFLSKLKKHPLQIKNQQNEALLKQQNQQPQSPNLILYSELDVANQKILPRIAVTATYASIIVFVITLSLFVWNLSVNSKLSTLLKDRDSLINELATYSSTEHDLNQIVSLTNKYKELKDTRSSISDDVGNIFTKVPSNMSVENFSFDRGVFRLSVVTSAPIDIAFFIREILDDDLFTSVVILSVTYNVTNNNFFSELEINM